MNIRRIAVVLSVAVGGVIFAATPASAAFTPSSFQEVWNSVPVPELHRGPVAANCPPGTLLVSAGGGGLTINSIAATAQDAVVNGTNGGLGATVYAQAVCAPTGQFNGVTTVSAQAARIGNSHTYNASVTCPAGMYAFGGGGYFTTANGSVSNSDYFMSRNSLNQGGRGWGVTAVNDVATDRLNVTAKCAPNAPNMTVLEENFPMVQGTTVGYAHCPAGYLPISGGAVITHDDNPDINASWLFWSIAVRSGQIGWFASGGTNGRNGRLHVIVRCSL